MAITLQCPNCGGVFLTLQQSNGLMEICPHCAVSSPREYFREARGAAPSRGRTALPSRRETGAPPGHQPHQTPSQQPAPHPAPPVSAPPSAAIPTPFFAAAPPAPAPIATPFSTAAPAPSPAHYYPQQIPQPPPPDPPQSFPSAPVTAIYPPAPEAPAPVGMPLEFPHVFWDEAVQPSAPAAPLPLSHPAFSQPQPEAALPTFFIQPPGSPLQPATPASHSPEVAAPTWAPPPSPVAAWEAAQAPSPPVESAPWAPAPPAQPGLSWEATQAPSPPVASTPWAFVPPTPQEEAPTFASAFAPAPPPATQASAASPFLTTAEPPTPPRAPEPTPPPAAEAPPVTPWSPFAWSPVPDDPEGAAAQPPAPLAPPVQTAAFVWPPTLPATPVDPTAASLAQSPAPVPVPASSPPWPPLIVAPPQHEPVGWPADLPHPPEDPVNHPPPSWPGLGLDEKGLRNHPFASLFGRSSPQESSEPFTASELPQTNDSLDAYTPQAKPRSTIGAYLLLFTVLGGIAWFVWKNKSQFFPGLDETTPTSAQGDARNKLPALDASKVPNDQDSPEAADLAGNVAGAERVANVVKALSKGASLEQRLACIDNGQTHANAVKEFFSKLDDDLQAEHLDPSPSIVRILPAGNRARLFKLVTATCRSGAMMRLLPGPNETWSLDWPLFSQTHEQRFDKFVNSIQKPEESQAEWFKVLCKRRHDFELPKEVKDGYTSFEAQGSLATTGTTSIYVNNDLPAGRLLGSRIAWGQIYLAELLVSKAQVGGKTVHVILDCAGTDTGPK